jgi:hypothetical protein
VHNTEDGNSLGCNLNVSLNQTAGKNPLEFEILT